MDNEARYIWVGGLLVIVSLALVASLVWLAGGESVAYQHYTIYFRHQSMDGLDVSSEVRLRGIKVGEVTDYAFVANANEAVRVNIKVDPSTPIHTNSHATVQRNIVTGIAAIELDNPDPKSPLLRTHDTPPWPVIAEGSSDFDKVTTNLSQMSNQTAQMLENVNQILDAPNRRPFAETLANLRYVSALLVAHKQALDDSLQSFRAAADALRRASDRIGTASTHVDANLALLTQSADATLNQTTHTLDSLQQQSVVVSQELQRLTDSATYHLNQIGSDVHQSARAINETGQRLSDPRGLMFGSHGAERAPGE